MTKVITAAKAREVDAFCRARNGNRYGYGEAFTTNPKDSTDCSGLVLQTGAILAGRTDWPGNRYGSTESFRLDHATVYNIGFKRLPRGGVRELGFQPIMLVGLQHGGGGVYSHTACTLFYADKPGGEIKPSARGIDWESRGGTPGVRYYDGARAWNDPLFHDFWYLDARLDLAAANPDNYTFLGDVGERVRKVQAFLNTLISAGLTVDGEYGPLTQAAVAAFQRRENVVGDGSAVGPKTLAALRAKGFQDGTPAPAPQPPPKREPVVVGPADDQLTMRFNCLGGQTLVEAVAEIRDKVCGTEDRGKTGVVVR